MKKGLILIITLLFLVFVGLSTWFNCSKYNRQPDPSTAYLINQELENL